MDENKTKEQLLNELAAMRQRIAELEMSESERKRVEEALKESEATAQALLNAPTDLVFLIDARGTILALNETAAQRLGRPSDELLGLCAYDLFPPELAERRKAQADIAFRSGKPIRFEDERAGTWFDNVVYPVFDARGEVTKVTVVARDITERVRAEGALRKSEERYRAVVEDQTELICRFQPDGTLTFVNEAYCRYFGKKQGELIGHSCMSLIPEEDREFVAKQFTSLPVENPFITYEHRVVAARGEIRRQQWTDRAIFDEQGRIVEYQSVGRDITEQKQADEATRRYSAELEALQRTSLQLTSSLDLPTVLDSIAESALSLVGATDCHIYLYEEASETFTFGVALWEDGRREAAVEMPRRDGLTATVARKGRSIVINDAPRHPLYTTPGAIEWGLQAIAGFPLKRAGRVLGVFTIAFLKPHTFSEEELRVLDLLANQAAIAIENARLFKETRQRSEELAALNAISQDITSSLDLDETLQRVVDSTRRLTGARRSRILLINPQARQVLRDVISGYPPEEKGTYDYERFEQGISGWVICEKRSALISDVLADERSVGRSRVTSARHGTKSVAVSPLIVRGEVIGTLAAVNLREDPVFTPKDMALVEQLAAQAAIAIENARLFEAETRRREEADALRQTALALTSALDRNRVIERILGQLQQVVSYDSASVQLLQGNRLVIIGGRGFPNLKEILGISFPVDSDSPNREVMRTLSPSILEDAPVLYEAFDQEPFAAMGIRSWLGVPMLIGERPVGMITLDRCQPGFYTQEHARLAQVFANQAAIAIENARLFEEEKRRATQLALINEVGGKAASILDLDRLMQEVARSVQESFNYYNVLLLLLDEGGREVVMPAIAGGFEHIAPDEARQSIDEGIIGLVVRTGKSWLAGDVSKDPYYIRGLSGEVPTKSEVCVPIKLGDKVIGALDVQSTGLNAFDQADVVAMEAVADRVAIGIENARLYEETQRHAEEMTALHEIGLITTSTLDLNEVLKLIYEQVNQLMKPDTFYVALYDERREEIRFEIFVEKGQSLGKFSKKLEEGGLTGWIVRSKQPLMIKNLAEESPPVEPVVVGEFEPETSYLGVPLMARGKVIGVISVQGLRPYVFSEEDQRFLSALANQAAIAIENARLYEETQRHSEHLAQTLTLSELLHGGLELEQVLEQIAQGVLELGFQVAINIREPEGELVRVQAVTGLEGTERETLMRATYHWSDFQVLMRERFRISHSYFIRQGELDWEKDFRGVSIPAKIEDRGPGYWRPEDSLLVPLWGTRGELLGLLSVDEPADGLLPDLNTIQTLEAFANQAAIAIENARLFEEIEERRMYLEGVLGAAPDAIVTLDARHRIAEWNSGAERLFGYSREEAVGQDLDNLIANPDVLKEAVEFTQVVMQGMELPPTETVRYRKDGSPVDVIVAGSPILVGDKLIGAVAVYTNITARRRMEEALLALSLIDELTGLYNRRGFVILSQHQLKTANRAKRRMLLLFADFDDLKVINDAFGHPEGDRALIEVADALRETFRESDIIARIAGDEFVVLAMETSRTSAKIIATRLQENLEARNARRDRLYKLSLSVGMARYDPEHPCSIDDLMAQADRAMYESKRSNHKS